MSRSEKKERAETTIRDMGLQDSMDTRIGSCNVKGLSGGQKRRVSLCIEILTRLFRQRYGRVRLNVVS
jgi:ABC-type multidrug transport system ATPase subunit